MKKSLLALLPLTAILTLAGCDGTKAATSAFKPHVTPTEFLPNSYSENMFVGESFSIKLLISPLMASDAEATYESSDTSVVTVDGNGNVHAVGKGNATVKVESKEKTVKNNKEVPVCETSVKFYVSQRETDTYVLSTKYEKMKKYQKNNVSEPRKLLTQQVKTYTLYKNDELFSKSVQYNTFIVDKDNAYAYFGGRDTQQKLNGGVTSREFGVWQFVTDENYHSYIYHDTDYSSKYLYVPTEFNLGTEATRIDTLYSILDSLFNSGRDLIEDTIKDSLGTDWFNYPLLLKDGGYDGDNSLYCVFRQYNADEDNLTTPLMENNLDIPAYIHYVEDDVFKIYWYKGNVKSYFANFNMTYYVNGVKHKLSIEERDTFTRDDFDIDPIQDSKYSEAEDIYDL